MHVDLALGICQGMVLVGDAKQTKSEEKSALVESRLNGPAATALQWVR